MLSLISLIMKNKTNIIFVITVTNYFLKNLFYLYIKIVKTIFKYLKKLKNLRLIYDRNKKLKFKSYFNLN